MHYTIKVYTKDDSILYIFNTIDEVTAYSHYFGAIKKNKNVARVECYMEGNLIGVREA